MERNGLSYYFLDLHGKLTSLFFYLFFLLRLKNFLLRCTKFNSLNSMGSSSSPTSKNFESGCNAKISLDIGNQFLIQLFLLNITSSGLLHYTIEWRGLQCKYHGLITMAFHEYVYTFCSAFKSILQPYAH